MSANRRQPDNGVDRAALAFSLLPVRFADEVHAQLTLSERQLLLEGISRVRGASDRARADAVRALSAEVRRGTVFPRPPGHDERDCPFNGIASHPRQQVADVFQRVAERDPLEVAVALCHLAEKPRREVWDRLGNDTRALVVPRLGDVHRVSTRRSRDYATDLETRLARSARNALLAGRA